MSSPKTLPNDASVTEFIDNTTEGSKRQDCLDLLGIYTEITGFKPQMWGTSIIGFGSYHYKSERSSQEGDWPLTGFSPRKQNLTLYFMDGFDAHTELLKKLGKHKTSKSCLYINKLSDIDLLVLRQLIAASFHKMHKKA
jgi:hypothetical protein